MKYFISFYIDYFFRPKVGSVLITTEAPIVSDHHINLIRERVALTYDTQISKVIVIGINVLEGFDGRAY